MAARLFKGPINCRL